MAGTKGNYKDYEVNGMKYSYDENEDKLDYSLEDFYKPYGGKIWFETLTGDDSEAFPSSKGENAPYYYINSQKKRIPLDNVEDAPNGATVWLSSQSPSINPSGYGKSKGSRAKKEREKILQDEIARRVSIFRGDIQRRKDADLKKQQEQIENKKNTEKANGLNYAQLLSDEGYDMGKFTTPEMLLKAATSENIPYKQFMEEVKNSKWKSDERLQEAIDKYYPEEVRDEERKAIWDVYKETHPNANFSDFMKLYENNDDSIEETKNIINQRKADAIAKQENIKKVKAEEDAKKVAELKKKADDSKSESEKRQAEAEAEKLARDFEKKYPFPIAQFWNPNWDLKKKVLLLGELLANMGSNITKGALEGFHGRTSQAEVSPTAQYFRNALQQQGERNSIVNMESAKSQANAERREKLMMNSPKLSNLGDEAFKKVSLLMEGKMPSLEEFSKTIKSIEPFRKDDEISELYEEFGRIRTSYVEGSSNYSAQLSANQAEENLKFSQAQNFIKTAQDASNYVETLLRERRELEQALIDVESNKKEDYWKAANYVMNFSKGIEIVSNSNSGNSSTNKNSSASSSSGWNDNISLNANLAVVGYAGIGGSQNTQESIQKGKSNSVASSSANGYMNASQVDVLQKLNIPVAKKEGKDFLEMTDEPRKALKKAIEDQIKYIDEVLIPDAKAMRNRFVNDGIIKAPHQKQWIVREDGTKVELDPMDNIYVTKNELTTENDNGADVVPMDMTDEVKVIQKKLGYDGGSINKDFDYYLTKLKK